MPKDLPINTIVAMQDAPTAGTIIRDFVYAWPRNRDTNDEEEIGFWTGDVPITVPVKKPQDGTTVNRTYSGAGQLLQVPSIAGNLNTEVRKIRMRLSGLSPEAANLFRAYKSRYCRIEIHRGRLDPETWRLVDPAEVRFRGYITAAPIKTGKVGGESYVDVECSSESRILTRTSGLLFSMETLKQRSGDLFGSYLDVAGAWRVWWGQTETVVTPRDRPGEKFFN